jgi:alpha-L-rhamnosidase
MMAEISFAIGKKERADHYEKLLREIKAAFAERYIVNGDLTEKSQTAYLLALGLDMVEDSLKKELTEKLKKKIEENDYTLSTGFVGTGMLCRTLSDIGLDGLAYSLLLQTKNPSWLFSVRSGATTVWERWNSYTAEKGFGNVGMDSFNHYAYGAVIEWMFAYMAGIQHGESGFESFCLRPRPDMRKGKDLPEGQKNISHVKAEYICDHGVIRSEWERCGEEIIYRFDIPKGTTARAEIHVPDTKETLEINGEKRCAASLRAIKQGGKWIFDITDGNYIIT